MPNTSEHSSLRTCSPYTTFAAPIVDCPSPFRKFKLSESTRGLCVLQSPGQSIESLIIQTFSSFNLTCTLLPAVALPNRPGIVRDAKRCWFGEAGPLGFNKTCEGRAGALGSCKNAEEISVETLAKMPSFQKVFAAKLK